MTKGNYIFEFDRFIGNEVRIPNEFQSKSLSEIINNELGYKPSVEYIDSKAVIKFKVGLNTQEESDLNSIVSNYSNKTEYTTIELSKINIDFESRKYLKRQEDGRLAVLEFMSELRLNAIENNLPREINRSIEISFEKVTVSIERGWWITAKEECDLVVIGGYVTQSLWDRIHKTITDYIAISY